MEEFTAGIVLSGSEIKSIRASKANIADAYCKMRNGELFVINKTDYARINQAVPKWPEIEKTFIARCFTVLEDRVVTHLALSAEERYEAFFQYKPELFNLVPLQNLASMLGMTPETFSRIRKKRSERNS